MVAAMQGRADEMDGAWVSSTLDGDRISRAALAVLVVGVAAQLAVGASAGHATWGMLVAIVCVAGTVVARMVGHRLTARWVGAIATVHLLAVVAGAA